MRCNTQQRMVVNSAQGAHIMTLSVSDVAEELRKEYADTPVAANQLVGMLRTLIAFGIPGGYIDRNPAIEVKPLEF